MPGARCPPLKSVDHAPQWDKLLGVLQADQDMFSRGLDPSTVLSWLWFSLTVRVLLQ